MHLASPRAFFSVIAVAAALAGCVPSQPAVVNAAPPTVSLRFTGDTSSQVAPKADQYCAQYGKRAQLQGVVAGSPESVANFRCM